MARDPTLRQIFAGTWGTVVRKVWVGLRGLIVGSDGSEPPVTALDVRASGAPPALDSATAVVITNAGTAGQNLEVSLICGTTGQIRLNFGHTTDEDRGELFYDPEAGIDRWRLFRKAGEEVWRADDVGFLINQPRNDRDFEVRGANKLRVIFVRASSDNVGINEAAPTAADLTLGGDGVLGQKEGVEPTATESYGKTWWESDGTFWGQDPSLGDPHLIVGPAYNIMRFHGIADHTLTITTQAQMTKFNGTNAVGLGDEFGNITGSTSTDELTVGAADGIYDLGWFASLSAQGGVSREVILNLGVELFTPIEVTGATGSGISPIVLTISGLLGSDGLLIEIVGVGGNTAANGSWIINASTSTTIELYSLNRVASTGDGTYTADTGELNIYYPSFNLAHTEISQNDLLLNGGGSTGGGVHLNEGDKVALYASNLDGTNALDFAQAVFGIRRISGPRSGVVPLVF